MADGVSATGDRVETQRDGAAGLVSATRWLLFSREGLLSLWIATATVALGVAGYFVYQHPDLMNRELVSYGVAASTLLWLPILLLLTDPEATLAQGPRLRLPLATTLLLLGLVIFAVTDHYKAQLLVKHESVQLAFFCLFALVLVPRVFNGASFARFKENNRRAAEGAARIESLADEAASRTGSEDVERKIDEYRSAEAISAFIVSAVVVLIIAAAYWVGTFPPSPSLGAGLGVGIFILVISLFAIVLCIDWLSELSFVRGAVRWASALATPGRYFAAFYDWADSGLVHIGGHVAGADHLNAPSRYLILGVTLLCLAILGWFLPPPLGLIPVLIGLIVGLSVSRIWGWVEEDRNLASITQFSPKAPQRIGFREDFRDETLLGFIFVLALIPVGMMQAHESELLGGPLFVSAGNHNNPVASGDFLTWLGYFGFELAKALPIVDWADIYNLGPGADSIEPIHPLGMHAVFAARALVDLLLIAALLQALGIASRNRQQKFLYAEQHIDRLDELVEKVELSKAIRACRTGQPPGAGENFNLSKLAQSELVDFRRYSEARLRELFLKTNKPDVRAFITSIFGARGVKPAPAMDIVQDIAASHRSELDLMRTFDEAKREDAANIYKIAIEDIETVLFELRQSSGMREIKFELIDYAGRLEPKSKYLDMLTTVAVGAGRDGFLYTRRRAAEVVTQIAPKIEDRDAVFAALAEFERQGAEAFGVSRRVWEDAVKALRERLTALT